MAAAMAAAMTAAVTAVVTPAVTPAPAAVVIWLFYRYQLPAIRGQDIFIYYPPPSAMGGLQFTISQFKFTGQSQFFVKIHDKFSFLLHR
jgi:hypothetical protein